MDTNSIPLSQARDFLPPEEFRVHLRRHLESNPSITLAQVGKELKLTRQRVGSIVGLLGRPNCASPDYPRSAPEKEKARLALPELRRRVQGGESAKSAAKAIGISLVQAFRLGFRSLEIRPMHGSQARLKAGCGCCRCRRAAGIAVPRGPRIREDSMAWQRAVDWLAWRSPDTGEGLTQQVVGKLSGISQMSVSRIARGVTEAVDA